MLSIHLMGSLGGPSSNRSGSSKCCCNVSFMMLYCLYTMRKLRVQMGAPSVDEVLMIMHQHLMLQKLLLQ